MSLFLSYFSLILVIATVNALYGPASPVLQLNPSNFKSKVIKSNGVVLVEFFTPWRGHCKAFLLHGKNRLGTVAALDADAHRSLAQEYGIKGFPTIKIFVPGKPPVDHQGARDAKPIAEFALQNVKALLKE